MELKGNIETTNHNNKLNHTGTLTITTDRLILRRFTIDDTLAVYNNWTSDSEVSKYMRWEHHKNIDETKAKINDWLKRYSNKNFYQWAITFKESDEPIGAIGLFVVNEIDMSGDFGYSISRKYWGMGIASEALKAVLNFAFETVGFNRIESYHSANNPASGKVMLKAGMRLEGMARQKYKSNVGFEDSYMYSIIKEVKAYDKASDYISKHDLQEMFIEEADNIRESTGHIGWGFSIDMDEMFYNYFDTDDVYDEEPITSNCSRCKSKNRNRFR